MWHGRSRRHCFPRNALCQAGMTSYIHTEADRTSCSYTYGSVVYRQSALEVCEGYGTWARTPISTLFTTPIGSRTEKDNGLRLRLRPRFVSTWCQVGAGLPSSLLCLVLTGHDERVRRILHLNQCSRKCHGMTIILSHSGHNRTIIIAPSATTTQQRPEVRRHIIIGTFFKMT